MRRLKLSRRRVRRRMRLLPWQPPPLLADSVRLQHRGLWRRRTSPFQRPRLQARPTHWARQGRLLGQPPKPPAGCASLEAVAVCLGLAGRATGSALAGRPRSMPQHPLLPRRATRSPPRHPSPLAASVSYRTCRRRRRRRIAAPVIALAARRLPKRCVRVALAACSVSTKVDCGERASRAISRAFGGLHHPLQCRGTPRLLLHLAPSGELGGGACNRTLYCMIFLVPGRRLSGRARMCTMS